VPFTHPAAPSRCGGIDAAESRNARQAPLFDTTQSLIFTLPTITASRIIKPRFSPTRFIFRYATLACLCFDEESAFLVGRNHLTCRLPQLRSLQEQLRTLTMPFCFVRQQLIATMTG
jgi:hypothetical protein